MPMPQPVPRATQGGGGVKRKVLVLGASYGSLLGTKILMAGHAVSLVCTRATAELINREGTYVRLPVRGRAALLEVASKKLPGVLSACTPEAADPAEYDLIVLAMQEPQYGAPGVRELMVRVARARKPCLAIMNMPPLPYLKRIPGLATQPLAGCYTEPQVWERFDPALTTLASPDPQAFRPPGQPKNVLQVGLPTNFKAARFDVHEPNELLRNLAADIESARFHCDGGAMEIPVKLKVHDSIFVPLAKWPMLLTGNYRCIRESDVISIRDAVHRNLDRSREIYDGVSDLCVRLGAHPSDLVPFEKYVAAAEDLGQPSAAARALAAGARNIERVDRLTRQLAHQVGVRFDALGEIVVVVDKRLERNQLTAERRGYTPDALAVAEG